jgi:hypothetical protein
LTTRVRFGRWQIRESHDVQIERAAASWLDGSARSAGPDISMLPALVDKVEDDLRDPAQRLPLTVPQGPSGNAFPLVAASVWERGARA